MTYTVSITSQGQISIPAKVRRELGFEKKHKASLSVKNNQLILEPIQDLLDLKGAFQTQKKVPFRKIREAFGEYLAQEAIKGMK